MSNFKAVINRIIQDEGGYVNDPTDAGGETKYGISKRSFPDLDIKNLSIAEATDIYERFYWIPSKAEKLPDKLQDVYFEMVINMGQSSAVRVLQKACNAIGSKLDVDGRIGMLTITASKRLTLDRLVAYQVLYYAQLVTRKPDQERFYFGWFKRAIKDIL